MVFPEAYIGGYPRGYMFGIGVGVHNEAGRDCFRKYHASAIVVPGRFQSFGLLYFFQFSSLKEKNQYINYLFKCLFPKHTSCSLYYVLTDWFQKLNIRCSKKKLNFSPQLNFLFGKLYPNFIHSQNFEDTLYTFDSQCNICGTEEKSINQ